MTDGEAFYTWLLDKHSLGERSARDVLSRCSRVEKLLGISLDKTVSKRLGTITERIADALPEHRGADRRIKPVISQLRRAVRLYAEFCDGRRQAS